MQKVKKLRSLRLSALLVVGVSLTVFALIFFTIFNIAMPKMLLQSEARYLTEQQSVVSGLLGDAGDEAFRIAGDIAFWEETVLFAKGENPDFIAHNWQDSFLLEAYRFNFVVIKDRAGNNLHTEFYDYINKEPLPVPDGFGSRLDTLSQEVLSLYESPVVPEGDYGSLGRGGIFFYGDTPYLAAAMPIMATRNAGDPVGTVIIGNILTNEYLREITHFKSVNFSISPAASAEHLYEPLVLSGDTASTLLPLSDIDGNLALLTMSDSRAIYTEGQRIISSTTSLLLAAVVIFAVVLYKIVVRYTLAPVEQLSRDVGVIESAGEIDTGKYSRIREFAGLCSSINEMVGRLNESQISLDVLRSILNGMDAFLYVSDPATDELLFINDKMVEHYGIKGEPVGMVCWQALQSGMTRRCSFCPNHRLKEDPRTVVVWEEHNTLTGRHYRNTDRLIEWTGKRLVHLQHSVDITDIKVAETTLQKRFRQQELMTSISQIFISPEDTPVLIGKALQMAGEYLGAGKIVIAALNKEKDALCYKYGWRNEKQSSMELQTASLPFAEGGGNYDAFIKNKAPYLTCSDTSEDAQYAYMAGFGVKSFVTVPISVYGELWGIITVDNCLENHVWSRSDIHLVQMISGVISGVISHSETRENLARMSSIVDSSPFYITYINAHGNFEYVNQSAVDLTGFSREELTSDSLRLIFDEEHRRWIKEEIFPAAVREGKVYFEVPMKCKNGQMRVMSCSLFTIKSNTMGLGAIATDITEKRQLEKDLIVAKEQAEQSSLAKSEFLSRMSHEMRTPLNAIIGMTGIARSATNLERKEYCLDKIDDASKHLLGVINDILDMSKIESGKFELSYSEFNVEKMLMRAINVVNFRADEKRQNLIVRMDKSVPLYIVSDEQRLTQVITNLLSNAVKFTPDEGSVTLSARCFGEEDGLCRLQVQVSDTGIGIAAEQQDKLFNSFEQADGGISRRFGGTGLGLAISKSIVEMMGGEIRVQSEPGKGAIFTFTVLTQKSSRAKQSLLGPNLGWKNLRILAVDDAPEVREYFQDFSKTAGLSCEVAGDGAEACRIIGENRENPFNIVFVDWKMPDLNGIELTKKIKKACGDGTVVIMISATQWSDIEREAKAAGVDRFIPKPLFASTIVDCINECLGMSRASPPAEAPADRARENCFTGRRILLAEDIEINREIILSLLEDTGLAIECAKNGREAYEMFRGSPDRYDMIFMDIHMPEMDGYEATRLIRALDLSGAQEVPIVAMTANVFREDIEKCLAVGMNGHIGKPVDLDEVFLRLREFLS